jgi:hypothetical protein
LLGLPPAGRQSFGCSPAIKGIKTLNPPKYARVSDDKRRSSTMATKFENSWQTALERTESSPKRCEWSMQQR